MRRNTDFLIVGLINVFLIVLIALGETNDNAIVAVLRIFLGFSYLIFIPGYAIQSAFLPRSNHIATLDRIVISFALSIALLPILGLILDGPLGGIFLWQAVVFLGLVTGVFSCIAIYRRSHGKDQDPQDVSAEISDLSGWWRVTGHVNRTVFMLLASLIVIAVLVTMTDLLVSKSDQLFTEFSILNTAGLAVDYPRDIIAGQPFTLKVSVANHEGQDITYSSIETRLNGQILADTAPFSLPDGQSISLDLTLTGSSIGDRQLLEILLLKDNQIYRRLYLWVDVRAPG